MHDVYFEPNKTAEVRIITKIGHGFNLLTVLVKNSLYSSVYLPMREKCPRTNFFMDIMPILYAFLSIFSLVSTTFVTNTEKHRKS